MPSSITRKKERKRKFGRLEQEDASVLPSAASPKHIDPATAGIEEPRPKRSKPSKKDASSRKAQASRKKATAAPTSQEDPSALEDAGTEVAKTDAPTEPTEPIEPTESTEPIESTEPAETRKPARFILFVGNLPYDTTTAGLASHFAAVQPSAIRHRTDKATGQSKGFAFLEFERYDMMETCLTKYHHSEYVGDERKAEGGKEDGVGGEGGQDSKAQREKRKARRINVELTAGGGGSKSTARKERLQTKNAKLKEERKKLRAKQDVEKKQGKKGSKETKQEAEKEEKATNDDQAAIHPSRRAQMQIR